MSIEIIPHPPEVIDVDPAVVAEFKRRMAEPKQEPKPVHLVDRE
jgi:hypothetical protein